MYFNIMYADCAANFQDPGFLTIPMESQGSEIEEIYDMHHDDDDYIDSYSM